jgi:hypothetical protein
MSSWWQMSVHTRSYSYCCLYTVSQFIVLEQPMTSSIVLFNRFLNGRCQNTSCPYSHELLPGKLPTCSYFIKGACGQDNCPYAHSYVGHDAKICDDFVQGFCSRGIEVTCVCSNSSSVCSIVWHLLVNVFSARNNTFFYVHSSKLKVNVLGVNSVI